MKAMNRNVITEVTQDQDYPIILKCTMSITTITTTITTTTTQLDSKKVHTSLSASSSGTLCTLQDSDSFYPSRILNIDARGIRAFRLPLPSSQTEISITNVDGSTSYVSTRARRWSGNSVLSHPKRGNLIRTDYFFGPNRDPVLCLLQTSSFLAEQVKITGKWTSRSARFSMSTGTTYEWSYAKERSAEGKKSNLIVLRALSGSDSEEKETDVVLHSLFVALILGHLEHLNALRGMGESCRLMTRRCRHCS
ncbi:hypothetical protein N7488_010623 [Penicillium malachiteum]|nr:hypothetical protein N7488_010623 [Penicillium malachiteum]